MNSPIKKQVLLTLKLFIPFVLCAQLNFETQTLIPNAPSNELCLTIDPYGIAGNISYCIEEDKKLGFAEMTSQGTWAHFQSISRDGDEIVGEYNGMVLDYNRVKHACYYNASRKDLRYWTDKFNRWENETVAEAGDVGKHCVITTNEVSWPYIAYYNESDESVYVAWKEIGESIWRTDKCCDARIASPIGLGVSGNSIGVCIHNAINGNIEIWSGSINESTITWSQVHSEPAQLPNSIDYKLINTLHYLVYEDGPTNQGVFFITNQGSGNFVKDTIELGASHVSIDLDSRGVPIIAYKKGLELKYAMRTNEGFVLGFIDNSGDDVGLYPSIRFDVCDNVYVAYYDYTNQGMKYAFAINPESLCFENLVDVGDGTVIDDNTGLMWSKDANIAATLRTGDDAEKFSWQEALDWVADLSHVGYTDWRLPSAADPDPTCYRGYLFEAPEVLPPGSNNTLVESPYKRGCRGSEMGHLWFNEGVKYRLSGPFENIGLDYYWTQTSCSDVTNNSKAWIFKFHSGNQGPGNKTYDGPLVWPVRDMTKRSVNSLAGTGEITIKVQHGRIANLKLIDYSIKNLFERLWRYRDPNGVLSWCIKGLEPGQRVEASIEFPAPIPESVQVRSVDNNSRVDITSLISDDDGDNTLILTITDGQIGDIDGIKNGEVCIKLAVEKRKVPFGNIVIVVIVIFVAVIFRRWYNRRQIN